MTIHLPNDLESSVHAAVRSGRFASVDAAMAEAVRLLLRELPPLQTTTKPSEETFKRQLLQSGLMNSLPTPADPAARPIFQPVRIEGEPLSETIIRERR